MNNLCMIGRICSDINTKYTPNGDDVICILNTNIAVPDRNSKKDENGNYETDFFKIVCFGKLAETIETYCKKGDLIAIRGKLKNNNYTNKDGQKVYSNEIHIDEIEFLEKKKDK